MADQMSLDGILNDEKPAAPAEPAALAEPAAPVEKPEAAAPVERPQSRKAAHQDKEQAAQGRVRDPVTGQFAAKVEEPAKAAEPAKPEPVAAPAKPAQPEMTAQERAYLAAAQDERRKRQAAEERVKTLEAAVPKEPEKQFFDDPEGYLSKFKQEVQGAITTTRVQTAESIARSRYTDFDEKIAVFVQIAQANPWIAQQCSAAADPAEFAYRLGKNQQELQQAGGLDALRAKIEQETEAKVRTKLEAELKVKAEAAAAERAALPGSLSGARSTGVNRPVWAGPTSLDNILGKA